MYLTKNGYGVMVVLSLEAYVDVVSVHMPLLEAMQTASRKAFKKAFC